MAGKGKENTKDAEEFLHFCQAKVTDYDEREQWAVGSVRLAVGSQSPKDQKIPSGISISKEK